ncbi:protein of unknown function (plasmid) [Caballeronia sp. S22]
MDTHPTCLRVYPMSSQIYCFGAGNLTILSIGSTVIHRWNINRDRRDAFRAARIAANRSRDKAQ